MDVRAKQTIWKQFQDLLPRSLGPDQLRILLDKIREGGTVLAAVYEAAIYAGWYRGYAEGDGAHRLTDDQRKEPWRWMRHGDNGLESMSDGMTILITAGELRELVAIFPK